MSVAPWWNGSGTTAIKWFLVFRARGRDGMYGLTHAFRRGVLLSVTPASRSNPLKEMVMYKASQLCYVFGLEFTCAVEGRVVFGPVALWSESGYKGGL